MNSALQQVIDMVNQYVGNLINVADMPEERKDQLKYHLLEAEKILVESATVELREVFSALTGAVLSRLG